jgi:hypothetical protein
MPNSYPRPGDYFQTPSPTDDGQRFAGEFIFEVSREEIDNPTPTTVRDVKSIPAGTKHLFYVQSHQKHGRTWHQVIWLGRTIWLWAEHLIPQK